MGTAKNINQKKFHFQILAASVLLSLGIGTLGSLDGRDSCGISTLFLFCPSVAEAQGGSLQIKRVPLRISRVSRKLKRALGRTARRFPIDLRSVTGEGNNSEHPTMGMAGMPFKRMMKPAYRDGIGDPQGPELPSARLVSNQCADQLSQRFNDKGVSDFVWQWGQFLDHDITLTPTMAPAEELKIEIPKGDRFFDPTGSGDKWMRMERSFYTMVDGVRQQVNEITAFIDASNVYGSDEARMNALREQDGSGRLKEGPNGMLPFNTDGFPNAPTSKDPSLFLAGDFRANEQIGLTAMHVLFVREHNYWVRNLSQSYPTLSGDQLFQIARSIVAGEMQQITFGEFLPVLLGEGAIANYDGYRSDVDASIMNEFATAAYRFGHSMLSPFILRLDASLLPIPEGPLSLRDGFFQPQRLLTEGGIDPVLRGLAVQKAQEIDIKVIDDVRNFLFGPPGAGGFDLAALNIQRSRDHGLPSYSEMRSMLGLPPLLSFADVTTNREVQQCLASIYPSVRDIDLWVGGLAEDHVEGAMVGETFFEILRDQFERLRDGDRFWYEHYLPKRLARLIRHQTLAKIIKRNSGVRNEIQENVFYAH
ncbi:MAG: peroxidase family protein [Bdellovibrionales bacterium]|nr:peroxidase family protein [Bdellovibrionales bacterium]